VQTILAGAAAGPPRWRPRRLAATALHKTPSKSSSNCGDRLCRVGDSLDPYAFSLTPFLLLLLLLSSGSSSLSLSSSGFSDGIKSSSPSSSSLCGSPPCPGVSIFKLSVRGRSNFALGIRNGSAQTSNVIQVSAWRTRISRHIQRRWVYYRRVH
jgi:hypothetical protein